MLSPAYELFQPIDLNTYFGKEIDERLIHENYNFDLIEKHSPECHFSPVRR